MGKKTIVYNGCGKFNINQSASVIKKARYVFTHDTGLMHIAAAFKKEIFSIWGNTIPAFGMYPYRTKFTILENNRLSCRPCSKIGYNQCPKGHFKCMKELVLDFYLP
jgi:ADP-heptose:LPS heptosyltransferase